MRRWVAIGLVAMLAGACSGRGDDRVTGPTVPTDTRVTTTTSTSTTLAPASYDVPEVIDQAYVQRVVSAYDKVLGDAIRVLKRDGGVSDEFLKHLVGLYTTPQFEFQQRVWLEAVEQGDLAKRPDVPGDPVTQVVGVVKAEADCVIAGVARDYGPTLRSDVEPQASPEDDYVVLVPKRERPDPLEINPTPWVLAFDGYLTENRIPTNSCGD